jgi:hypothetical protein
MRAEGEPQISPLRYAPPKVMKNASVRHPRFMEALPFPCHPDRSEAERRDLQFRRPFVEMFFDRA